jgi:hypothetical protein
MRLALIDVRQRRTVHHGSRSDLRYDALHGRGLLKVHRYHLGASRHKRRPVVRADDVVPLGNRDRDDRAAKHA